MSNIIRLNATEQKGKALSMSKRRLLFYLDQYLDPFYKNDLTELYEPLKKLLQEVMISDNDADVIEDAHHLLEEYMEIE